MRPLSVPTAIALTLLVSACASVKPAPASSDMKRATDTASSGAPLAIAGYDWFYNVNADEVSLSYGMARTDDVPLNIACRPGSGTLTLLQAAPDRHGPGIALESGGDTETYPAHAEPSPLHDGVYLTAQAKAADPVFKRFRTVGWLAVMTPERTPLVPHPASLGRIERFFAACG